MLRLILEALKFNVSSFPKVWRLIKLKQKKEKWRKKIKLLDNLQVPYFVSFQTPSKFETCGQTWKKTRTCPQKVWKMVIRSFTFIFKKVFTHLYPMIINVHNNCRHSRVIYLCTFQLSTKCVHGRFETFSMSTCCVFPSGKISRMFDDLPAGFIQIMIPLCNLLKFM